MHSDLIFTWCWWPPPRSGTFCKPPPPPRNDGLTPCLPVLCVIWGLHWQDVWLPSAHSLQLLSHVLAHLTFYDPIWPWRYWAMVVKILWNQVPIDPTRDAKFSKAWLEPEATMHEFCWLPASRPASIRISAPSEAQQPIVSGCLS